MRTYKLLQIWELNDYERDLCVKLSNSGRHLIKERLKKRYRLLKTAAKELDLKYNNLLHLLRGRWSFKFKLLLKLIKLLNLYKDKIQTEIEDIILRSIRIRNVKFPISCDPVFASLAVNLLGDGCVRKNNTGVFHYDEKECYEIIQNKIEHILGQPSYKNTGHVPAVLVFLIKKYYNINSFYTKESILPEKLLHSDKFTKVASLTAFINDEGTVRTSSIILNSSNNKLLEGIKTICKHLGYDVSKIKKRKDKEVYSFRIKKIDDFWSDYKELIKKFPSTKLISRKERILRIRESTKTRPNRSKVKTMNLILSSLKECPKTIHDICEITQLTESEVSFYLKHLINSGLVKREQAPHDLKVKSIYKLNGVDLNR